MRRGAQPHAHGLRQQGLREHAVMPARIHPLRSLLLLTIALGGTVVLGGCGSDFDRQRVQTLAEIQRGDYTRAEERLNGIYGCHEAKEPDHAGGSPEADASLPAKHLLLWRMERGMVAHLAGDFEASNHHLDDAARLVDERRTKSLAGEAGTFLANDTVRAYAGHGFEHIQVDYYRILNQLEEAERAAGLIASSHAIDRDAAEDHYGKAVTRARRMTLEELPETADLADQHRYRDDPFARFLAGAVTWALPPRERREEDEEFAQVMFKRSLEAYTKEEEVLGDDKYFRWEVERRPHLVERLALRHALAYDPSDYERVARLYHLDPERRPVLPPGDGMLLVLNHVGFISRPRTLSIGFGTIAPELNSSDRANGASVSNFTVGGLVFWAKGPGSEIVGAWVVPLPSDVMAHMTPGGIGIFGMELPVFDREHSIRPPGRVLLHPQVLQDPSARDSVPFESSLEVVSDLDAYARATLKDEQPRLLAKTITRAVAKQIVVGGAAEAAKKSPGGPLLAAVVDLVGSTAATVSEVADLRAWTTLPDHIEGTLIDLPAGSYSLEIESSYGTRPLGTVHIPVGQLVITSTRTFPDYLPDSR